MTQTPRLITGCFLLTGIHHHLERVTRTKRTDSGIFRGIFLLCGPLFQPAQVLFCGFTGENLDFQPKGAVLLGCCKDPVDIFINEFLADNLPVGIPLCIPHYRSNRLHVLAEILLGFLLLRSVSTAQMYSK